ncbi:DUF4134 domain-containing protein [Pedobacter sp. Du54]|uniref:DUF4134 domain-containing protein n=1 Tax=Pedobacter anseongensis TaxID=3133439 RepID=UPI00309CA986
MKILKVKKQSQGAKPKEKGNYCRILSSGIITVLIIIVLIGAGLKGFAQDGNAGIQEATNKVKGYFDTGCDLMYAIGAVVGIIGAVKVFNKWNAGEPDTNKVAAAWFGSCIFLVVVATVLKSFFGI